MALREAIERVALLHFDRLAFGAAAFAAMPPAGDRTALARDVPVRTASPGMMAPDKTEPRWLAVCRPVERTSGERRKAAPGSARSCREALRPRPTRHRPRMAHAASLRRRDRYMPSAPAPKVSAPRCAVSGGSLRLNDALSKRVTSALQPAQYEASICEGNGSGGLEAQSSAPANAKTTHHGTHLYSHHPLTFNRLTAR